MNNGKICVSVCAETADEFIENIKLAAEFADIIEVRLDCLKLNHFLKVSSRLSSEKLILLTYRPKEQGGKINADFSTRIAFWNAFVANGQLDLRKFWIDCEFDLKSEISNLKFQKIISYHDFAEIPGNLNEIYNTLSSDSGIPKIAVQANEVTDSIAVWKLLERTKREKREIIPIAMGEAGKWTRILGLAHGAFMTYASLNAGSETAPGQISAKDLIEVYRVKELDENTEIYGVVGENTSYSVSPFMHNAAFKFDKRNAVFVPLQVKNLDEFMRRMVKTETREIELKFKGFSVTIPHKQAIIKHLDFIDETARAVGAVNTVKISDGKLYGYNTDAHGFIEPLKTVYGNLRNAKVTVFGAGGAARACVYALKKENAEVTIFARNPEKAKALADEFEVQLEELQIANRQSPIANFDIVVNTTPLGTKGALESETILFAEQIETIKLVYDLVYNPFQTRLMQEADKANVPKIGGMAMLVAQGAKQFEIWTEKTAPVKEMSAEVLQRLK